MAKIIHDNVLGPIEIENQMLPLLDHPATQRLRRLGQLGTAALVFPGATHTRLAHSVGAQEIMRRVWRHLEATEPPQGVDNAVEGRLLRAAALLHDLGHYPLSHVVEPIAVHLHSSHLDPAGLGLDPDLESDWLQLAAAVASRPIPSAALHHERLAAQIIKSDRDLTERIDTYVGAPDAASEVRALIKGCAGKRYRRQLLSSHFDVDRLDYLLRDAQNTGVRYGGVEIEHLIRRMRLGPDGQGDHAVYVETKGQPALEHYVLARRFMYSQVVFHSVVTAFSVLMAALWISLAVRDHARYTSLDGLHNAIDDGTIRGFDDNWLWSEAARRAEPGTRTLTARVATALIDRRPPLLVWESRTRGRNSWAGLLAAFNGGRQSIAKAAHVDVADIFLTHQVIDVTGAGALDELKGALAEPEHLARLYLLRSDGREGDGGRRARLQEAFLAHVGPMDM